MIQVILMLLTLGLLAFGGLVLFVYTAERQIPMDAGKAEPFGAIVVLGAQVREDGTPSVQLQWRLDAAAKAWRRQPVTVIVCGAQGSDEPMPEALVMKQVLMEAGIPEESILTDSDSFNTRENLENARKMIENEQTELPALIVSSQYHVPRALALARDVGLHATGLGSPCKAEFWVKNHFREALSWVKYWGVKYLHLPL